MSLLIEGIIEVGLVLREYLVISNSRQNMSRFSMSNGNLPLDLWKKMLLSTKKIKVGELHFLLLSLGRINIIEVLYPLHKPSLLSNFPHKQRSDKYNKGLQLKTIFLITLLERRVRENRFYGEKLSIIIATNLSSICCVYKEKIVKNDLYRWT